MEQHALDNDKATQEVLRWAATAVCRWRPVLPDNALLFVDEEGGIHSLYALTGWEGVKIGAATISSVGEWKISYWRASGFAVYFTDGKAHQLRAHRDPGVAFWLTYRAWTQSRSTTTQEVSV